MDTSLKAKDDKSRTSKEIVKGYSRKKDLGGEEGRRYIFLWVVGA